MHKIDLWIIPQHVFKGHPEECRRRLRLDYSYHALSADTIVDNYHIPLFRLGFEIRTNQHINRSEFGTRYKPQLYRIPFSVKLRTGGIAASEVTAKSSATYLKKWTTVPLAARRIPEALHTPHRQFLRHW